MKELSIEGKAKAYDEAINRMKHYVVDKYGCSRIKVADVFPKLKEESEDERIRKELLEHCKNQAKPYIQTGNKYPQIQSWIAWLEKQGEQNPTDKVEPKDYSSIDPHFFKPIDNVKPKFHEGEWLVNIKYGNVVMVLEVLEDNYRLDFGGDTIGTLCIELVDNDYRLWTIQDAKDGDVLATLDYIFIFKKLLPEDGGVSYCHYDFGAGNPQFIWSKDKNWYFGKKAIIHPATKEHRDLLFAKMKEAGYEWDAEKKELKKVEPMFNDGDWITDGKSTVGQVISINEEYYHYICNGIEQPLYIPNAYQYHLWTIQDTKDGDVLVMSYNSKNYIFIFKQLYEKSFKHFIGVYGFYCEEENTFYDETDSFHVLNQGEIITPSVKEQRDILFQKMKEAGYEWDAEKKELKKIGQKSSWSEEDEKTWKELIEEVKDQLDSVPAPDCRNKEDEKVLKQLNKWLTWLNFLKDRVDCEMNCATKQEWKPSDEQIEILDMVLTNESMDDNIARILRELREQLKKLSEE